MSIYLTVMLAAVAPETHAPASEAATAFKAAAPPAPDRTIEIKLPSGFVVRLRSVRFAPAFGSSEAVNTVWCGLLIESPGLSTQSLVTIGQGFSEALSCEGIAEAGLLNLNPVPRIGLVYRTQSPNAESLTPVVIAQTGTDFSWIVDDLLSTKLADLPGKPSLAWMRHALVRH